MPVDFVLDDILILFVMFVCLCLFVLFLFISVCYRQGE